MLNILAMMAIGIAAGFLIRKKQKTVKFFDLASGASVYVLLFLLGISVGKNETIVSNLGSIGIRAISLAIGAVSGSVISSFLIFKIIFKDNND
ncbi:LysO family transporter [candidate division WOR-3 bacterium]|nr:LysO family transporter [candidate division WOR-3 bacterium]